MTTCHPKSSTTLTTRSKSISIDKLLKPKQVADLLKVTTSTIYQWSREGYLPCINLGVGKKKAVRFHQDEIEIWVLESSKKGRTNWVPEKAKDYE